ncbi:MAG: winged helix-turn-helix domain-containing protein [Propioniciclava sp.]
MQDDDLTARVARLEEQVAHLAQQPAARPSLDDQFAHLAALEADVPQPGGVLMVGSVTVAAGPVRWEWGQTLEAVQESDWTQVAGSLSALAHPVRLTLMKLVLEGTETTGDLLAHPELASTGKLHHHLRQLVAEGWLVTASRGRHTIPPERVVPLLVLIMAARR